jgi:hypothetical protein
MIMIINKKKFSIETIIIYFFIRKIQIVVQSNKHDVYNLLIIIIIIIEN